MATLSAEALHRCLRRAGALPAAGAHSVDDWLRHAAGGSAQQAASKAAAAFHHQCKVVQTNMAQTQQKKKIMQMLEKADIGNLSRVDVLLASYFK